MEVGGLIGLMVEEEGDIKNIDYGSVDTGSSQEAAAATPEPAKAAPAAPKETA